MFTMVSCDYQEADTFVIIAGAIRQMPKKAIIRP